MMKRALILALVVFGAVLPVVGVGVAQANPDTACQCNDVQAP
jgi:hypothetical protein